MSDPLKPPEEDLRQYYTTCTEVSATCPIEATVLGYYPNLGANIFFAIAFGICTLFSLYFFVRHKTWSYSLALVTASILETAGYIGRILLHKNPWNTDAFQLQICAIILAPTVLCISIYLTLKHVCLSLSPGAVSRIRPHLYPYIFVPGDVTCLVVQAIGGSMAAAGGYDSPELVEHGNRAIIAGIAMQVAVLGAFGVLGVDYFVRAGGVFNKGQGEDEVGEEAKKTWEDGKFWWFVRAIWVAYGVVFARCVYRIAEMAGGWGNHIMQDEPSFIVLDSCAMLIAVSLLTFFPPGILFPHMAERMSTKFNKKGAQPGDEAQMSSVRSALTEGEKGGKNGSQ